MRDGRRWFWWFNLLPWSAYLALSLVLGAGYYRWHAGAVLLMVVAASLYLASGILRSWAWRAAWLQLDGPALAVRLGLGVLAGAVLVQVLVAAVMLPAVWLGGLEVPGGRLDYRPAAVLAYWFNAALLLGIWTAGWGGARVLERARRSEIARLRAEAEHSALERDALRARLNPHFVFNALNNLRALINEDPARARDMVTRLSATLRHALEQNVRERVTLAEELAVVDDYLAIEAIHYERRLQVRRAIAADALDARLPPMALQLLVENAIRHGIAVTPGGGEVTLHASCEGGRLRLEVGNPGRLDAGGGGYGVGLAYLRAHLDPDSALRLDARDGRVHALLEIAL